MTSHIREIHQMTPAPENLLAVFQQSNEVFKTPVILFGLVNLTGPSSRRTMEPFVLNDKEGQGSLVACIDIPGFCELSWPPPSSIY